jgi:CheY-like chemotaxis protein
MKILLVENDVTVVNAIMRLYQIDQDFVSQLNSDEAVKYIESHHNFIPQTDLDSALQYVREQSSVDLVMLDLRMNGKGRIGLEVYRLVREMWGPDVFVGVITGCEDDFLFEAEEAAKIDMKFVVYKKPLTNDKLKLIFSTAKEHISSLKKE